MAAAGTYGSLERANWQERMTISERSNGLPCRFVLFDDPIQSMDDDHTEAFKKTVIHRLLTNGFQVLLLTHMDTFALDVERLYRASTPALYKMESYTLSGPNILPLGPAIKRLLAK